MALNLAGPPRHYTNPERNRVRLKSYNTFHPEDRAFIKGLPEHQDVPAGYRTTPWPRTPPIAVAGNDIFPGYSSAGVLDTLRRPHRTAERRDWLASTIEELATRTAAGAVGQWRCISILGSGISGKVGLWRYDGGDDNDIAVPREVAVKQIQTLRIGGMDYTEEAGYHQMFSNTNSCHIVHFHASDIITPQDVQTMTANPNSKEYVLPAVANTWLQLRRRIIMEYCELGSLYDLLERRDIESEPFHEETLWKFFECLVDGISVLSEGVNYVWDQATDQAQAQELGPAGPWVQHVHFDMKPHNIMLGERDAQHPDTPILKLADFGLTEEDWAISGIAGIYGTATNVWAIGFLMYSMIHLATGWRPPLDAFLPTFMINGGPARGITYGESITTDSPISVQLRDLIFECLYMDPAHRPSLRDIKERVCRGLDAHVTARNHVGDQPEGWDRFIERRRRPSWSRVRRRRRRSFFPGCGRRRQRTKAEDDAAYVPGGIFSQGERVGARNRDDLVGFDSDDS
ncbi:Protein kinase-like (PK-like) [Glarea lozoyensis ATCC 20868]|uniref:Protein kinase-like (PK-like) n=1 Tax=Glarea lozoyensis (strain ATCC 20868 / MF5171) TaxID=1116229 RepID=S3DWZ5_GLAL2|nr:Protein kinase-like (PK-like) [Glarea lozoyensis ATCC 20868]EPE30898.1 Protein kinase-like (PK-like) [Glarea lozoyensis ATCC 20868]